MGSVRLYLVRDSPYDEHLDKASTAYGMEISAEKTKLMTDNTSGINTEIKVNGQSQVSCTWAQF